MFLFGSFWANIKMQVERIIRKVCCFVPVPRFCKLNASSSTEPLLNGSVGHGGRTLSTLKITKNLHLITATAKPIQLKKKGTDSNKFALECPESDSSESSPLLLMPTWLMAEKKHIMKYANIYLDQGFHVLWIPSGPWDLLFPTLGGGKVIGKDVFTFLVNNPQYKDKMIHSFSVGAFIWAYVLIYIHEDPQKYDQLINSFRAQFVDRFHLRTFDKLFMRHYWEARSCYYNPLVRCPTIYFCSHDDPIGTYACATNVTKDLTSHGIDVRVKCWDKSQHVLHMLRNPVEYKTEMKNMMERVGILRFPEKFQVDDSIPADLQSKSSRIHSKSE